MPLIHKRSLLKIASLIFICLVTLVVSIHFIYPYSVIYISIPKGFGEIQLDGQTFEFHSQIRFIKPGSHLITLNRPWHRSLRLTFTTSPAWLPLPAGQTLDCLAIPTDPDWIMGQSLAESAAANPPWLGFKPGLQPQLSEAALALSAIQPAQWTSQQQSLVSWLAQLWLTQTTALGKRRVNQCLLILAQRDWRASILRAPQVLAEIGRLQGKSKLSAHGLAEPGPLITQGQWQLFLRANPAWSGRQRPQLLSRGLVTASYIKQFEEGSDNPRYALSQDWINSPITQINIPAITAYIAWLKQSGQGNFRLPQTDECQANRVGPVTAIAEWTATLWPDFLNRRLLQPAWNPPFSVVALPGPQGRNIPVVRPGTDCPAGVGFRLVPIAEK